MVLWIGTNWSNHRYRFIYGDSSWRYRRISRWALKVHLLQRLLIFILKFGRSDSILRTINLSIFLHWIKYFYLENEDLKFSARSSDKNPSTTQFAKSGTMSLFKFRHWFESFLYEKLKIVIKPLTKSNLILLVNIRRSQYRLVISKTNSKEQIVFNFLYIKVRQIDYTLTQTHQIRNGIPEIATHLRIYQRHIPNHPGIKNTQRSGYNWRNALLAPESNQLLFG